MEITEDRLTGVRLAGHTVPANTTVLPRQALAVAPRMTAR
jgi:hypothetical protein